MAAPWVVTHTICAEVQIKRQRFMTDTGAEDVCVVATRSQKLTDSGIRHPDDTTIGIYLNLYEGEVPAKMLRLTDMRIVYLDWDHGHCTHLRRPEEIDDPRALSVPCVGFKMVGRDRNDDGIDSSEDDDIYDGKIISKPTPAGHIERQFVIRALREIEDDGLDPDAMLQEEGVEEDEEDNQQQGSSHLEDGADSVISYEDDDSAEPEAQVSDVDSQVSDADSQVSDDVELQ